MKRILCYGDSNMYGYNPHSYLGGRYPENVRWTGLLKWAGWEVVNEGENGREIPIREWEVQSVSRAALQVPPVDMERFLRELKANILDVRLLLIAPPPMHPGAWVYEERLLKESARLRICYWQLAEAMGIDFADAGIWNVETAYDGVHFSEAGHA